MKFRFLIWFIFLLCKTVLTQDKDGFCQIENADGQKDNLANCSEVKKCLEFDPEGLSIFVKDSSGRLGNHMFAYSTLMSIKLRYGNPVYLARRSHELMSKYFHRLEIPIAEDHLCGFDQVYKNFSLSIRHQKLDNIEKMVSEQLGVKVKFERDKTGRVRIPPEIASHPKVDLDSVIHSKSFDTVEDLRISQETSYPWKVYTGSIEGLANTSEVEWLKGKAFIIVPPSPTDLDFVNNSPGLPEKLDQGFKFKPELMDLARETLRKVVAKHEEKEKKSKKKKKSEKKEKEYTFVGIHSRRTDHVAYDDLLGNRELTASYYLEAMDMYREHYGKVIFLYISDDMDWGRKNLGIRKKAAKDLYFVGEGEGYSEQSVGHDLAVISLCNHTIISHGTFSFWSGFLAGGNVISPNHFPSLRPRHKNVTGYDGHPLKEPVKRLHFS